MSGTPAAVPLALLGALYTSQFMSPKLKGRVKPVVEIMAAIPSVVIGFLTIGPMLFGDFFKDAIFVNNELHPAMEELAHEFHGAVAMGLHSFTSLPFILALANPEPENLPLLTGVQTALPADLKAPVAEVLSR